MKHLILAFALLGVTSVAAARALAPAELDPWHVYENCIGERASGQHTHEQAEEFCKGIKPKTAKLEPKRPVDENQPYDEASN